MENEKAWKPDQITIENVRAFGPSEIALHEDIISVKAGKGGGICTESFQSREEQVLLRLGGRAKPGTELRYSLLGYDAQNTEQTIVAEDLPLREDGGFETVYRFDPISLGVYQNAVRFRVALRAETENAEFCVSHISLEEGQAADGKTREGRAAEPPFGSAMPGAEEAAKFTVPQKVLFVGNSLLLGMFNRYGMCASSPRKDYAYYVQQEILKYNKDCVFTKLHGSGFEHAESMEAFDEWFFREPNTYTQRPARESFTEDLELILLQLTDNVNTDKKIANFKETADLFLKRIRALSPKARIVWVHGWYNKYNTYDWLVELCRRWKVERIDISDLHTRENEAFLGQLCENAAGENVPVTDIWVTHPGDKGMREIAGRILKVLGLRK